MTNKKIWKFTPILFSVIILLLLFVDSLSFDFIGFKTNQETLFNVFFLIVSTSPFLILFFFDDWKPLAFHKKILLTGIIILFVSVFYASHIGYQLSVLATLAIFYYFSKEKKIFRPDIFVISLFIYFIVNAISLFWSPDKSYGVHLLGNISPLVYIPLLFCFFNIEKKDFNLIMLFLFRYSVIFAFISISTWVLECRFLDFPLTESLVIKKYAIDIYSNYEVVFAWSNHIHPTYNGLLLTFALTIGWYYFLNKKTADSIHVFEFVFFVLATFLLALITSSRFMLISWIIVNAAGILFILRKNKVLLATVSILYFVVALGSTWVFFDKFTGFINDPIRSAHLNVAFESIQENTWHGTGIGGMTKYINVDNPFYDPLRPSIEYEFNHIQPHNQLIGDLMQTGVFGVIAILAVIIILFFYGIKFRSWLIIVNLLMFLLLMSIEMPLIFSKGIFSFALIFNLLLKVKAGSPVIFETKKQKVVS